MPCTALLYPSQPHIPDLHCPAVPLTCLIYLPCTALLYHLCASHTFPALPCCTPHMPHIPSLHCPEVPLTCLTYLPCTALLYPSYASHIFPALPCCTPHMPHIPALYCHIGLSSSVPFCLLLFFSVSSFILWVGIVGMGSSD